MRANNLRLIAHTHSIPFSLDLFNYIIWPQVISRTNYHAQCHRLAASKYFYFPDSSEILRAFEYVGCNLFKFINENGSTMNFNKTDNKPFI